MECNWFKNLHRAPQLPWKDIIKLIFNSAIAAIHIVSPIFEHTSHMEHMQTEVNGYFSFCHYINILTASFPAISASCLLMKRNNLTRITHDINSISETFGIRATSSKSKGLHFLFLLVLLMEYLYEFGTEGYNMLQSPTIYTYYIYLFMEWLVLREFANRFSALRFYYGHLSKLLNNQRVEKEKVVKCHEVLGNCSATLWECYALQMTILFICSFVISVSYTYLVVDSYSRSGTLTTYHHVYLFWSILHCFFIWLVVYSCAETKNMAKKFNKKLSQLIMYDNTNKLINNKRIMHHYNVKFKDFSALGFFTFDYPLLFSMVSSATTYIVILVQFSGRDDS